MRGEREGMPHSLLFGSGEERGMEHSPPFGSHSPQGMGGESRGTRGETEGMSPEGEGMWRSPGAGSAFRVCRPFPRAVSHEARQKGAAEEDSRHAEEPSRRPTPEGRRRQRPGRLRRGPSGPLMRRREGPGPWGPPWVCESTGKRASGIRRPWPRSLRKSVEARDDGGHGIEPLLA
jgi:hypothetical protein